MQNLREYAIIYMRINTVVYFMKKLESFTCKEEEKIWKIMF